MEKQISFRLGKMEKQQSFRVSAVEKQKSFRISMGRQMSFGVDKRKSKDSPGKRGDSMLDLACRGGNLAKVIEILQNLGLDALSKQNQEGETPLYVAAKNGHSHVVAQFLKHLDLQTASIAANNGYDPFHKTGSSRSYKGTFEFFPESSYDNRFSKLNCAAAQGHVDVVNLLLDADSNLAKIAR